MSECKEKLTLIELSSLSNEIELAIEQGNGEVTLEIETLMERLKEQLPTKVDQVDHALDRLDAMANIWRSRSEEASRIRKGYETAYDRLIGLVKVAATSMGVDEIKGNQRRFKISKTSRLEIVEDSVPISYKDAEMIFKTNKDRVKEAVSAGKEVPGARMVESLSVRRYANKGDSK